MSAFVNFLIVSIDELENEIRKNLKIDSLEIEDEIDQDSAEIPEENNIFKN